MHGLVLKQFERKSNYMKNFSNKFFRLLKQLQRICAVVLFLVLGVVSISANAATYQNYTGQTSYGPPSSIVANAGDPNGTIYWSTNLSPSANVTDDTPSNLNNGPRSIRLASVNPLSLSGGFMPTSVPGLSLQLLFNGSPINSAGTGSTGLATASFNGSFVDYGSWGMTLRLVKTGALGAGSVTYPNIVFCDTSDNSNPGGCWLGDNGAGYGPISPTNTTQITVRTSLQLTKAWGANSVTSDTARIAATTGGTNNTALFTAVGGTAATSGTAVNISAGNTIALPAETFTTGTLTNYTTALTCTANGGATANPVSSSNGQVANTLLIGAGDTNKAIVCTYTNTVKFTTLQLTKSFGAGSVAGATISVRTTSNDGRTGAIVSATATNGATTVNGVALNTSRGATITLPVETYGGGATAASYITTVSCTNNTGPVSNASLPTTFVVSPTDVAVVCTYTNTPKTATLQLKKIWGVNSNNNDAITVTTTGGNANASMSSTALVAGNTDTGTAATVTVDNIISLPAETFTAGLQANYTTRVSCNNTAVPLTNATLPASFKVAGADTALLCTYTNTPKTATLQLKKAWSANSASSDTASIAATTGGTNDTAPFAAAGGTAATSGTAVLISAGNTIALAAETFTTGTLANYTTAMTCTANGGDTANPVSGTAVLLQLTRVV